MYELLYTSVANYGLEHKEFAAILDASKKNNPETDITGMLVFTGREFIQLLEGDKEKVQALYEKITQDNRHHSTRVFYEGGISKRSFYGWSMADKLMSDEEIAQALESREPSEWLTANPNMGRKLFEMLKDCL